MTTITQIGFEDIKVGDTILLTNYMSDECGVALRIEPLYDEDPEAPEMVWYFDGMMALGNWMQNCKLYRMED